MYKSQECAIIYLYLEYQWEGGFLTEKASGLQLNNFLWLRVCVHPGKKSPHTLSIIHLNVYCQDEFSNFLLFPLNWMSHVESVC